MIVYVDDLKFAAKTGEHVALWASIRAVIDMDPETLGGRLLGCSHERITTAAAGVHAVLGRHPASHPRKKQGVPAHTKKLGDVRTPKSFTNSTAQAEASSLLYTSWRGLQKTSSTHSANYQDVRK